MKRFLLTLTVLLSATTAQAANINFNSAVGSANGYSEQGVTFTQLGGSLGFSNSGPSGSRSLLSIGDGNFMKASFASSATSVSIDLGDFNGDPERLFLSIFDSFDNLIASITKDIPDTSRVMHNLSLTGANIAYATFGATGELGAGGIYADNFSFRQVSQVPVPAAAFLFGPALLGFIALRRKQK